MSWGQHCPLPSNDRTSRSAGSEVWCPREPSQGLSGQLPPGNCKGQKPVWPVKVELELALHGAL